MAIDERPVEVPVPAHGVVVSGDLSLPAEPCGVVVFAHGTGSSRHSRRNRQVAADLVGRGLATLLIDLLTADEEAVDLSTRRLRFDIPMLAERVGAATSWLDAQAVMRRLPTGYFGASTGAAAALVAAARAPDRIGAVVSRGGRPDLAGEHLAAVRAPT